MTQKPKKNTNSYNTPTDVYRSPLHKLFSRQQPKVKAKKAMSRLLLTYAENDYKRIAQLFKKWMDESS